MGTLLPTLSISIRPLRQTINHNAHVVMHFFVHSVQYIDLWLNLNTTAYFPWLILIENWAIEDLDADTTNLVFPPGGFPSSSGSLESS